MNPNTIIYALDPLKFKGYTDDGLCPNCGFKLRDNPADIHMSRIHFNGLLTWGCMFVRDDGYNPVRPGMLVGR